jgi:hypothetical protein
VQRSAYNRGVPHVIEPASSGRAKCRGCDRPIAKGELRFGERQPNAFGEGEMTLWFHLPCAAYARPEPFLEIAAAAGDHQGGRECRAPQEQRPADAAAALTTAARFGIEHRRVPRIHGAERAPTSRARCRSCKELIAKGEWRIALVFFEEFRFEPGGFVHAGCAQPYFETIDVVERIRHFSPELGTAEIADLEQALRAVRAPAA